MMVLDTLISGYDLPRGPLHSRLRGAQLVYVVHASNWPGVLPGTFFIYANTQPDKVEEVVSIIRQTVRETLGRQWTQGEIDEAINIILTSETLGNQAMADLATQAALDELFGFGYDYHRGLEDRLRAVAPADLHRVANKYLAGPAVEVVTTPRP